MKKVLIVTLLLMALVLPASAEQPAAEQYRQMFASGNFYVEYQMYMLRNEKARPISGIMAFAGQNGDRMYPSGACQDNRIRCLDGKRNNG